MDLRFYLGTFVTIFLAELGDKTQLTAMSLSASGGSRVGVIVAASMALVCSTTLAVLGGEWLTQWVSMVWLKRAAGTSFIVLGLMTLYQSRP